MSLELRPLKRAIQNCIEDALSDEILSGSLNTGDRILIDAKDGKLSFEKEEMFVMATKFLSNKYLDAMNNTLHPFIMF